MQKEYSDFLKSKVKIAASNGFTCDINAINPKLKLHNKLMVKWMVEGGRRACFASFGLHKTVTQLEAIRCTLLHTGGNGLIICPLGVRAEFIKDAVNILGWEIPPIFIRKIEEVTDECKIYLTNYETVRDGKLDPRLFNAVSLDEASILRGLGGSKTFREFMRLFTGDAGPNGNRRGNECVPYRFVATASPSPNEYIELLAYADFLGVMDVSQAKTRFFKRDSTKADKLTIHAHKEEEFWLWVASWALFVTKPSDLTGNVEDDLGYELPEMDIRWHELPSDHSTAGNEKNGQGRLFKNAALGLQDASREKRESLDARIHKMLQLRKKDFYIYPAPKNVEDEIIDCAFSHTENFYVLTEFKNGKSWSEAMGIGGSSRPISWMSNSKGIEYGYIGDKKQITISKITDRANQWKRNHLIIWHDLESERYAIEKFIPQCATVYGKQELEEREKIIAAFSCGEIAEIAGKPCMIGSGTNLQKHCSWAIYLGIGFKFNDFIQSVHRLLRFLQQNRVRIDLIYTEAERQVRKQLERKWHQHNLMVKKMTEIIKQYGLSQASMAQLLSRKMGIERVEVVGKNFKLVQTDNVLESKKLEDNSIGLILTSVPFSTQYEYSPNYADFGHTENNDEFFQQMDYLTPELYRSLMPGRLAVIHVKDRIIPSGLTGLGFQTVYPFHLDCINHYRKHGFGYMGMKTIVTDVVRENNQTYRLGWTEQCKDGSKMGVGMPEYLLIFRKPPTDTSNSYADVPVVKQKKFFDKASRKIDSAINNPELNDGEACFDESGWNNKNGYSRARWQIDAHGFTRSNGNRHLQPEELIAMEHDKIFKVFRDNSMHTVYDFEHHVKIGEALEATGKLPSGFMLLQPQSWSDEVWTDITRMLTLNGSQWSKGKEMHLCPMQFDIADRVIEQMSNEGDTVLDPFGGLMTVPYRAILKKRVGIGFELNPTYFLDGVSYCRAAEAKVTTPTLFDFIEEAI